MGEDCHLQWPGAVRNSLRCLWGPAWEAEAGTDFEPKTVNFGLWPAHTALWSCSSLLRFLCTFRFGSSPHSTKPNHKSNVKGRHTLKFGEKHEEGAGHALEAHCRHLAGGHRYLQKIGQQPCRSCLAFPVGLQPSLEVPSGGIAPSQEASFLDGNCSAILLTRQTRNLTHGRGTVSYRKKPVFQALV